MKKILIIEDNTLKEERLKEALNSALPDLEFSVCRSIKAAYPMLDLHSWDLVLLDMSFQVNQDVGKIKKKPLAGRQILQFMRARELKSPVIVVTQHSSFFEGQTVIGTIEELDAKFKMYFPDNYRTTVFVDLAVRTWHQLLASEAMRALHESEV